MLQKTFRIEYFEPISNPNTHSMDNIFRKFWRAETSSKHYPDIDWDWNRLFCWPAGTPRDNPLVMSNLKSKPEFIVFFIFIKS